MILITCTFIIRFLRMFIFEAKNACDMPAYKPSETWNHTVVHVVFLSCVRHMSAAAFLHLYAGVKPTILLHVALCVQ